MNQNKTFTRRSALRTLAGLPLAAMIGAPRLAGAAAPEYVFKYGNNLPTSHPLNVRAQEAAARIAQESNGRMEVRSEEHTSELQSRENLVCRLLLEKK